MGYLHSLLDDTTDIYGDKTALSSDVGSWTYKELQQRSVDYARWFDNVGARRGDRVVLIGPHDREVAAAVFGASRRGLIFVIVNSDTPAAHMDYVLADADPIVVLSDEGGEAAVAHSFGEVGATNPDADASAVASVGLTIDPACLIYTSGSTAFPKGVISTHAQIRFATSAIAARLNYRDDDVVLCSLPLSFDYGLYQLFLSVAAGAEIAISHSVSWAAVSLLNDLDRSGATVLPCVPSLASILTLLCERRGEPPAKLRMITNTGAALPTKTCALLRSLIPGVEVFSMFGLTECKRVSISEPNGDITFPGAAGRPLDDTEVRIVDADGNELPIGEVGELVVRGPNVMAGYWKAPELTAMRYRPNEFGQLELFTGDMCRLDEHGNIYFQGRGDDIYKQNGFRVSGSEIEAAALVHQGVHSASLLVPTETHDAVLVVSGRDDLTSEAVIDCVRGRLEPHKVPSICLVLPNMPLNSNGKVDKKQLEASLAQ